MLDSGDYLRSDCEPIIAIDSALSRKGGISHYLSWFISLS